MAAGAHGDGPAPAEHEECHKRESIAVRATPSGEESDDDEAEVLRALGLAADTVISASAPPAAAAASTFSASASRSASSAAKYVSTENGSRARRAGVGRERGAVSCSSDEVGDADHVIL